jgi:hypothetical protein
LPRIRLRRAAERQRDCKYAADPDYHRTNDTATIFFVPA